MASNPVRMFSPQAAEGELETQRGRAWPRVTLPGAGDPWARRGLLQHGPWLDPAPGSPCLWQNRQEEEGGWSGIDAEERARGGHPFPLC